MSTLTDDAFEPESTEPLNKTVLPDHLRIWNHEYVASRTSGGGC